MRGYTYHDWFGRVLAFCSIYETAPSSGSVLFGRGDVSFRCVWICMQPDARYAAVLAKSLSGGCVGGAARRTDAEVGEGYWVRGLVMGPLGSKSDNNFMIKKLRNQIISTS
ncbi:hypothetical protein ACFX2J_042875 [Malus domestica]